MNPEEIIKQAKLILSENNNNYIGEIKTSHHEKEIFRQDSFIKISTAPPGKFELDCEGYATSMLMCRGFYTNLIAVCSTFDNYEKRKIGLVKVVQQASAPTPATATGSAIGSSITLPTTTTATTTATATGASIGSSITSPATTPAPPSPQYEFKALEDTDADYFLFWNNLQGTTSKTRYTVEFGVASVSNDRGGEKIISVYDLGATQDLDLASFPSVKYSLCNYLTDLATKMIRKAKESDELSRSEKNQVSKNQFIGFMNSMFGGNSRGKA